MPTRIYCTLTHIQHAGEEKGDVTYQADVTNTFSAKLTERLPHQ